MRSRLLIILLTCLILGSCSKKEPIYFYGGSWESVWLINQIAAYIIENGYGYPVIMSEVNEYEYYRAFEKGKIEIDMEAWLPNFPDWHARQTKIGTLIQMGNTFESGPQFFMIPKWVAEEHQIETIKDMKEHWELFRNPQNPGKGLFYNCIVGWSCLEINRGKLQAYGLDQYYDIINPGSSESLEQTFIRAQEEHRPVFGYYWEPSPLMGRYEWHILKEPPYSAEIWRQLNDAVQAGQQPKAACAYEAAPVAKFVYHTLPRRAPQVTAMIGKMEIGLEPLNSALGWAQQNNTRDWRRVAIHYLRQNPGRWQSWVTPSAAEKIKRQLANEEP